jgi:hypothetical protein
MGFITAAIVGGLVLGAAAVNDASKDRKAQQRAMDKQEREARNLARTPTVLEDTGADIQIGTDGEAEDRQVTTGPRRTKTQRQVMSGTVGGLFRNRMSGGLR